MENYSSKTREIMRRKRHKTYMDRVGYLRCVKNKNLSMPELHFLTGSRRTVARQKVISMQNHAGVYDSKKNISLNRFFKLDREILIYQLINKGYNEEFAEVVATNILKNQFDNYLYRSIDLRDYFINVDLTVELKDAKEIIKNLDNQIDYESMKKENNKR